MQDYFNEVSDKLFTMLSPDETLLVYFQGEESDFTRFNKSKIRQSGIVFQSYLSLELVKGLKHACYTLTLSCDLDEDLKKVQTILDSLRSLVSEVPEDPHLLYNTAPVSSVNKATNNSFNSEQIMNEAIKSASKFDLVGFLSCGKIYKGFANSLGQKNWFEAGSFNFDWSLCYKADKAVKGQYAGSNWDSKRFNRILSENQGHLEKLKQASIEIKPGSYRAYLAPAALAEIIDLLTWGGFSYKAIKIKTSPLLNLFEKKSTLSPKIKLFQDNTNATAPNFDGMGYTYKKDCNIIKEGEFVEALISPRTAKEFGLKPNNPGSESPKNVVLTEGSLEQDEVLKELDTGIYISNLWYLNYSDHSKARITGMTRYACFWVEKGKIKAPIEVMRFDVSAFHIFGEGLIDLCSESELLLSNATYDKRNTSSMRVPGALIKDFALTL